MSVNPLDLQVNFNSMNQVSKQQALSKESQVLRQDQASENLIKDSEKNSDDVPETKNLSEGPGKVKDEEKKNELENKKKESEEEEQKEEDKEESDDNNILNNNIDPNLGQNIDVMG